MTVQPNAEAAEPTADRLLRAESITIERTIVDLDDGPVVGWVARGVIKFERGTESAWSTDGPAAALAALGALSRSEAPQ